MTAQGSALTRLDRALDARNVLLALATASELPRVPLPEALAICLLLRDKQPERYELEEQMTSFTGLGGETSPDRLDAMVWAMTELKNLNWHGPHDPTGNTAVPYTTTPPARLSRRPLRRQLFHITRDANTCPRGRRKDRLRAGREARAGASLD
jgi:hypothetical protein